MFNTFYEGFNMCLMCFCFLSFFIKNNNNKKGGPHVTPSHPPVPSGPSEGHEKRDRLRRLEGCPSGGGGGYAQAPFGPIGRIRANREDKIF